jgi:septum formation protein
VILASASPARLAVLRAAGLAPDVVVSGVPEDGVGGLSASDAARTLAERKAAAVLAELRDGGDSGAGAAIVVGCDSLLSIDGEIRGKPESGAQAREWWRGQRGRTGTLVTGHAVIDGATGRRATGVAQAAVRFGRPTDEEIDGYVATREPLGVAGAFTLDGYGAPFVDGIDGDHGTVLGISLPLLRTLLGELGISIVELWEPRA